MMNTKVVKGQSCSLIMWRFGKWSIQECMYSVTTKTAVKIHPSRQTSYNHHYVESDDIFFLRFHLPPAFNSVIFQVEGRGNRGSAERRKRDGGGAEREAEKEVWSQEHIWRCIKDGSWRWIKKWWRRQCSFHRALHFCLVLMCSMLLWRCCTQWEACARNLILGEQANFVW